MKIKPGTLIAYLLMVIFLLAGCAARVAKKEVEAPQYDYSKMDKITIKVHKKVEAFLETCQTKKYPVPAVIQTRIDSVRVDKLAKTIDIHFSKPFSFIPLREQNVAEIYEVIQQLLGREFNKYTVIIYTLNKTIEQLIPNFFRDKTTLIDYSRMPSRAGTRPAPLVRNLSKTWLPTNGLLYRNIALWHSHGWYYNIGTDRWEWQRPRLFQTVEDLLPMSLTIPYLIPMLENAGAYVFVPRERDLQVNEAVVDNDTPHDITKPLSYIESSTDSLYRWRMGRTAGFAPGSPPYPVNFNPFTAGTSRMTLSDTVISASASWIPNIPADGNYAVYVSYSASLENSTDAHYIVNHEGGQTEFVVNQQIGGNTWIYLGRFKFRAGQHPGSGRVTLVNLSADPGRVVSADGVRFGGGMGNVLRNGRTSGRARCFEASRYYLQYTGMPDTLVYNLHNNQDDYKDDYRGRPEWVNYLVGAPLGPNKNRNVTGLGIPIDLALGLHTDAGITRNDTTIGTLAIYSVEDADSQLVFPNGVSRLANRDLADMVQTQVITDLRQKYDTAWNRRQLLEARYSETVRPNVPAMLLELLSHQNFLDIKFILDPRFRFDVSRAIYKGILKFISFQNQYQYTVQPLPVSHFQVEFSGDAKVTLKWQPETDPLEPGAVPIAYMVYRRIGDGDFDNGQMVKQPQFAIDNLTAGVINSFKVTAINNGGESFPSEILSACWLGRQAEVVLIINGFDRVAAPAHLQSPLFTGLLNFLDSGVPDRYDFSYTGNQFDFNPDSEFRLNDAPGHGASYGDYETTIIPGNTFDFPYLHGKSIKACGYSFTSTSDEAVMDSQINLASYKIIDLILGEEKATGWPKPGNNSLPGRQFEAFPPRLQQQITKFCQRGGNLFVSGAYVGTDLCENKKPEHPDVVFARQVLKINWITNHAARTGKVHAIGTKFFGKNNTSFSFNTEIKSNIYAVEAPDALGGINGANTILRYLENGFSAASAYKKDYGVVVFGFPFETIMDENVRDNVMLAILEFFKKNI